MKKGIIMEEHQDFIIVMTSEGLFQKASPVKNASIGSEVNYNPLDSVARRPFLEIFKGFISMRLGILSIICLLLVLIIPFFFVSGSSKTYAYVSVDINPSLSIKIDKELHVNDIKPMNEEASLIINKLLKMKGKGLEDVLGQIMNESEAEGLTKNGKNMIVGVSYVQSEYQYPVDVQKMNLSSDWEVTELTIPKEIRETADRKHVSMNKEMVESVEESPDEIDQIDSKKKEIIHIFYNNKFYDVDDQSNITHKDDKET